MRSCARDDHCRKPLIKRKRSQHITFHLNKVSNMRLMFTRFITGWLRTTHHEQVTERAWPSIPGTDDVLTYFTALSRTSLLTTECGCVQHRSFRRKKRDNWQSMRCWTHAAKSWKRGRERKRNGGAIHSPTHWPNSVWQQARQSLHTLTLSSHWRSLWDQVTRSGSGISPNE